MKLKKIIVSLLIVLFLFIPSLSLRAGEININLQEEVKEVDVNIKRVGEIIDGEYVLNPKYNNLGID